AQVVLDGIVVTTRGTTDHGGERVTDPASVRLADYGRERCGKRQIEQRITYRGLTGVRIVNDIAECPWVLQGHATFLLAELIPMLHQSDQPTELLPYLDVESDAAVEHPRTVERVMQLRRQLDLWTGPRQHCRDTLHLA